MNLQEWVVIDDEEYEVRPKPSQQDVMKSRARRFFGGTFKRCHNPVPCVNGVDCTFAHNKGELMVWNGEFKPLFGCHCSEKYAVIAL